MRIFLYAGIILMTLVAGACQSEMGDDVAALVNGQPITRGDVAARQRAWTIAPMSQADTPELRRTVLSQLIEEALILQAAEKAGITVSDREVESRIDSIKKDFPENSFQEMLIREYIDFETWRDNLRRNMIIEKATQAETAKRIKTDPEKWQAFFEANRALPEPTARIKVIHLTLADRDRALAALKKIRGGQDFEKTAKQETGGPTGNPIWVYPNMLPADMAKAIAATEPGQVTDVVESEFGFTIFKILDKEKPERPDPVLVMARLRREFRRIQEDEAFREWVAELKQNAKIIINPEVAGLEPDQQGKSE